jgi:hypothetical protein
MITMTLKYLLVTYSMITVTLYLSEKLTEKYHNHEIVSIHFVTRSCT